MVFLNNPVGRNNERSPVGESKVTNDPNIFIAWLEVWVLSYVLQLKEHPKRFNSEDLKVGDIVVFLKNKK